MKPYKLKHVPTGLYYQPFKHRGSNLSKLGKIYQTKSNILTLGHYSNGDPRKILTVFTDLNSRIYKEFKDKFQWEDSSGYNQVKADTNTNDWIQEELS